MQSSVHTRFKRIQSPIDVGFLIGVGALVLVGVLSLRTAVNQRLESRWVEHTYQVLRTLDGVRADVEMQRQSAVAEADLPRRLALVRTLTADNPDQQARLDSIAKFLPSHPVDALATVMRMQDVEQNLAEYRSNRSDLVNRRSLVIISASTVLAVVMMGVALSLLHADLRRRQTAEEALVASEANYRLLMQRAADAIVIVNSEAMVSDANDRAAEMIGRPRSEIIGLALRAFVRSDRADSAAVLPMLRYGHITSGEFWVLRPDGSRVAVEIRAALLDDGRIQIIARDISERKEVERMKDEFVSVVSHELRTPLTALRGSLGLLASGRFDDTPEKRSRMFELATSNTDRLIRLVNDILDVERIDSGNATFERKQANVAGLIEGAVDVVRPMAERSGVTVEWNAPSPSLNIWADADRITQTLTNLIDNAVKFSPSDSVVTVMARQNARMAQFEIRDHGRGIPQDKRDLVFKRFQQVDTSDAREKGGSGLGLAIARSIVEQHDGTIWIADTDGAGTTFCFTIPLFVEHTPALT
jgi:PAS domain S-box-containing protein